MITQNKAITRIPILDLKAQYASLRGEIGDAIQKVLDEQSFILGPEVNELERRIAQYCGTRRAVGVNSGTDALFLAARALGIGSGDEVIAPSFTFVATGGAIFNTGARPVFADIDPLTYTIDPADVRKKIGKRTKAVMPVHLYGMCARMDEICSVAKEHGIRVIEDNAQAIGAEYKGKRSGALGDIAGISFFPGKNLGAYGDAGAVVTDDEGLDSTLRKLRVHGSTSKYIHELNGYNSRLDNIQAAVLLVKLKYLDAWTLKRQENAHFYNASLKGLPLATPSVPEGQTHVYHQYTVRVPRVRDALMKYLDENGVEARVYYPIPLHLQQCFKSLGYRKGDLPETERAMDEALSLPVYSEMSSAQKEYVVAKIKAFFSK